MTESSPEILRAAANLIEQHGWVQNDFGSVARGFCVTGALYTIAEADHPGMWDEIQPLFCPARDGLTRWLRKTEQLGCVGGPVFWNDKDDQTKENVVQTLRDAADYIEKGEPADANT